MTLYQSFHKFLDKNSIQIESGSNEHMLLFYKDKLYYAYVYDQENPYYFRLILPYIADYNGQYDAELNKYALELAAEYKVGKLIVVDGKMWAAFEQLILDTDANNDVIYKMGIRILGIYYKQISEFINKKTQNATINDNGIL